MMLFFGLVFPIAPLPRKIFCRHPLQYVFERRSEAQEGGQMGACTSGRRPWRQGRRQKIFQRKNEKKKRKSNEKKDQKLAKNTEK